jgi:putative transposase
LPTLEYIDWFNHHRRLHSEIGMVPPAELEAIHYPQTNSANTAEVKQPSLH